jgi:hypothetical protein
MAGDRCTRRTAMDIEVMLRRLNELKAWKEEVDERLAKLEGADKKQTATAPAAGAPQQSASETPRA